MLTELDANRAMYTKDPAKLDSLVANVLLPNFDSEYAARLCSGSTGVRLLLTSASASSMRFTTPCCETTATRWSTSLRPLRDSAVQRRSSDTQATVRTEVKKASGEKVPVNFTLHKTDAGWKAWDVVIEGISYVKSFEPTSPRRSNRRGWTK